MRLNGKDRIITEDDIILSGSSLSERFESQQQQINQLQSNVKWIYKYGGVGKGSGGGSSSSSFSVYATLNGIQLKDQTIVLNGANSYHLYIKINNPNDKSFNVKYSYTITGNTGHDTAQENTQVLSISNNYTIDTYITLNNNAQLIIVATDGNDTKQVSCSYVTNPYSFDLVLLNDKQIAYNQEEIFISTAAEKGLNVALQYTMSINATATYEYEFNGVKTIGEVNDKTGRIIFPIDKSLYIEENSGYYNASIKINVLPENQEPIILTYNKQFSLVPESLYVLLLPQSGYLYKEEVSNPVLYKPGYIAFNYRIYEGTPLGRTYTVKVYLNNQQVLNNSILEREQNDFKIFSNVAGLNTLTIEAIGTTIYRATYYFYVDENQIDLNWLDNNWQAHYYRINETTQEFTNFKNKIFIEQTVNSATIDITGIETPNLSGTAIVNTHIAVGIQYNAVNNVNPTILQFFNENKNNSILDISQATILRDGTSKDIYIQKQENANANTITNYHLLQVYSQYVKSIGNENYYQLSIYIDGRLEAEMPQLVNTPLLINSFKILPVNCFINCIDIDYKEATSNNNCDYEVYRYYLKYQNSILGNANVIQEAQLLQYLTNFHVSTNGRVEVDQQTISNISANIDTPTMMLVYENDSDEDFMTKLEKNYGEDGTGIGSDLNFPVTIQWSPGKKGLQIIQFPDEYVNAQFRVGLQGSSTKGYRSKNFYIEAENTVDSEQAEVYLFSPNFSNEDSTTFLPERRFNLKADVVDSSHSNNTTCGKFVNTVCKKFYTDTTNPYSSYVRNCLEGFPMLLYLNVIETDRDTGEKTKKYYYLGIYNFNLGREAYFNLGYRNLNVFCGENNKKLLLNAGDSFTFYKLTKEQDTNVKGLGVAEIQGGSPYFDFSQFDKSILFEQATSSSETKDITYMFGDLVRGNGSTDADLQNAITNLVKNVALSGGYLFDFLKKNKGSYEEGYNAEKIVDGKPSGESLNQVPDYTTQYTRQIEAGGGSIFTPIDQTPIKGTEQNLIELLIPDVDSHRQAILDYQSLAEYYTICMVLGLVDSVMKNLNIKTWNLYTWVLAFYDMDTCLGLNNAGRDISYFAFSDYWYGAKTTLNGIDYPNKVSVYRDFSPRLLGDAGYDIPSSYLFAVAKYARLRLGGEEYNAYMSVYPQDLYAKWRSNTINKSTNEGVLKNADYFMEHFFSNNIGSINAALVSYNYRAKYLSLGSTNSTVWINNDYVKFHGTRINKVRDWLNGRLHILDVYFNLNRQMVGAFSYLDNNEWKTLKLGETPISDLTYRGNYNISSNPDVIILHDIFSEDESSAGVQLSVDTNFTIKCPEYSPLQICSANNAIQYNYILGGQNLQNIRFKTSGNQSVKLGGSQAWTYLESINWVSSSGNLLINSANLETIYGSDGSFAGIELRTPNAKTIRLNSSKYTGELKLKGSSNFPNLSTIDLSNSKLGLDIDNLNVSEINISNIQNNSASIKITNCTNITKFICKNTNLQLLSFLNIPESVKDIRLENNKISTIDMSCNVPNGSIFISNDSTLSEITIAGFKTVYISNCPKLKKVTFKQSEQPINDISIINCINSIFTIVSTAQSREGYADFSNVTTLQTLKLTGTLGIKHIILPPNVKLLSNACSGITGLQTVTGTNVQIAGTYVFQNCNKYGLKTIDGNYTDFHTITTDISGLFSYSATSTAITRDTAKHFITNCINPNVTNISYLFYGNTGIEYGLNEFRSDLANGTKNYIDLSKLVNVTNANCTFGKCKVRALHKNMLKFGGTSLTLNGFIDPIYDESDNYIYATLDSLTNIITKVTYLFGTYENNRYRYMFLDNTGNIITEEIRLKDFFNPNGQSPTNLKTLSRFYLNTTQTFDLTDLFTSSWASLTYIEEFLWASNQKYKGINKLFYNLPKLKTLGFGLLTISALEEERTNLYTLVNWEAFINREGTITSSSWLYTMFDFRKEIALDDYNRLCNLILKSSFTNISCLFYNCNIIGYPNSDLSFGTINVSNSLITDLSHAFRNCRMYNNDREVPIPLSATFFKNLPNITDVPYTFSNMYLKNPIPFNFFNKRIEDNSKDRNVYVKIGEEYKQAYLTEYTYKHDIKDFRMLFYQTRWEKTQYDPTLYNIPQNKVEYNGSIYDTYYIRVSHVDENNEVYYTYKEQTISQGTEVTDALNLKGYYIQQATYNTANGNAYHNFGLGDNKVNALCIPPDLFYGVVTTGTVYYQYALYCATPLQGIIPKNIFKYNRSGTVTNTFKDQHIIPQLVKTYQDNGKTVNIYTHFPSKYTTSTNLADAFNCQSVIPMNDSRTINWVFILLKDSIPQKVTNLSNAFAIKTQTNYWYNGQTKDDNNYINYMGNITSSGCTEGFDMDYYDQLRADYMFYSELNSFIYGRLFNSTFNISNIAMSDVTNKIFSNVSNQGYYTSQYIIFPTATSEIPYVFNWDSTRKELKSNQIPIGIDYYKTAGVIIND